MVWGVLFFVLLLLAKLGVHFSLRECGFLFLHRVLPMPSERVLLILSQVRAFLSTSDLRMHFPGLLRGFFVLVRGTLIRRSHCRIDFTTIIVRKGRHRLLRVVVGAMTTFRVVGGPLLVNGTIFRVLCHGQRDVVLQFRDHRGHTIHHLLGASGLRCVRALAIRLLPGLYGPRSIQVNGVHFSETQHVGHLTSVARGGGASLQGLQRPALHRATGHKEQGLLLRSPPRAHHLLLIDSCNIRVIARWQRDISFQRRHVKGDLTRMDIRGDHRRAIRNFVMRMSVRSRDSVRSPGSDGDYHSSAFFFNFNDGELHAHYNRDSFAITV